MAEYILFRKSRNALSSFLHVFLNLLLGVGSIFITVISGSWVIGVILVLVSKWRIFAVRPRYWFLNIKSNLVDLIVGASFVILAYFSGTELIPIHIILAALYSVWLIFIKPLSSQNGTLVQSLFALFFGTSAAVLTFASHNSALLVIAEFFIGYGASRHLFAQGTEGNFSLMTLVCGLLCAELAWLCHSWDIIYTINELPYVGDLSLGIVVPQLSIILSVAGFAFAKIAFSIVRGDGEIRRSEILPPAIFSIIVIAVIVIGFSNPIFNV